MAKLFNIEGISKTPTCRFISVYIEGREAPFFIVRNKFEKWVNDDGRYDKVLELNMEWELYYESHRFEQDIYDYIVIRQGSQNFDIQSSLTKILN